MIGSSQHLRPQSGLSLCHLPQTPALLSDSSLPTVYLIRHGESEYNHFHSLYTQHSPATTGTAANIRFATSPLLALSPSHAEPDIVCIDAPLTALGRKQAMRLRAELQQYRREHEDFSIECIISSPLSRALQTCLIALADYHQQFQPPPSPRGDGAAADGEEAGDYVQAVPIMLHPECAEHCYCLADIGRPLPALLSLFSHFSFDTAAFAGRESGWWYAAKGANSGVWDAMAEHYPDQLQRRLEMDIARSSPSDRNARRLKKEEEDEKAAHPHVVSHQSSAHNSPHHGHASHHAVTTPPHRPRSTEEEKEEEGEERTAAAAGGGDELLIRLHPQLVQSEPHSHLQARLVSFLHDVCSAGRGRRVCVVAHSQVINSLGQGWLENGEMIQMDWSRLPQHIAVKLKDK